jgi:MFS family permease
VLFLKESLPPEQRVGKAENSDEGGKSTVQSFRHILSRPVLAMMVVMGFFVFFAMTNFETTFPFWSNARFGWGPQQVGSIFMYLGFIVMVTQMFIVGKLTPIFGEGKLLLVAAVCYIFGLLFMATVPFTFEPPDWKIMMFGITFTAFGGAMFNTASTSWVSKQAGDRERGSVLGLFQSAGWLGRSVGPTISGLLFQTVGPNAPLFAGAILMVPVFIIVTAIRRHATAESVVKESP